MQCWIYKNFPFVGFVIAAEDYDERKPCACRWKFGKALLVSTYCKHLDILSYTDAFREFEVISLFFRHIIWGPSIVIHRPERIVRQFRHVQTIPPHPPAPSLCIEDINNR